MQDLGHRVKAGETYERRTCRRPSPPAPQPQAMPLAIVYEDAHLIVIDKPAGLAVHPGPGHASGTLVNALIAHCGASLSGIGGVRRPGIVHRLDKDTTGLLVVAKTDRAHHGLAEQFAAAWRRRPARAPLPGDRLGQRPSASRGTIDAPLARSRANRTKIAVVGAEAGRRAVTHYEVLATYRGAGAEAGAVASLLELTLETGRTHQMRVHLAHIGHPAARRHDLRRRLQGERAQPVEPTRRRRWPALGRQALHAAELAFVHPVTGKRLPFESAAAGRHGAASRRARRVPIAAISRRQGANRSCRAICPLRCRSRRPLAHCSSTRGADAIAAALSVV